MYAGTKKSISTKQSNNNGQTAKFSQNHNQKKVAETKQRTFMSFCSIDPFLVKLSVRSLNQKPLFVVCSQIFISVTVALSSRKAN